MKSQCARCFNEFPAGKSKGCCTEYCRKKRRNGGTSLGAPIPVRRHQPEARANAECGSQAALGHARQTQSAVPGIGGLRSSEHCAS